MFLPYNGTVLLPDHRSPSDVSWINLFLQPENVDENFLPSVDEMTDDLQINRLYLPGLVIVRTIFVPTAVHLSRRAFSAVS